MSKITREEYRCEKCNRKLNTFSNHINIVTSLSENGYWSRLHIKIEHHHGMHNDGNIEDADLCKSCTVKLLEDALKRVKSGERLSAGIEHPEMTKFGEV